VVTALPTNVARVTAAWSAKEIEETGAECVSSHVALSCAQMQA